MKVTKVAQFGNIPGGTKVWLTEKQAGSRMHLLSEVESSKKVRDRKLYLANGQLGFKAGEELSVEGDLDAGLELMFGLTEAAQASKEQERNKVRAIAKVETDVQQYVADLAAAEKAETDAADDAAKLKATEAVATARQKLEEARASLVELSKE